MKKAVSGIKKNAERKLRSESGSSILFAMLLLIVCAAIGSVVLTAGTAASGRMSKTAEMDQRFYAVQSAAQLFKEQLDGQSVEIVRIKTRVKTEVESSIEKPDGSIEHSFSGPDYSAPVYKIKWADGNAGDALSSANVLINQVAVNALCGGKTNADEAWSPEPAGIATDETGVNLTLSGKGSSIPAVSVKYSAAADGSLTFIFGSGSGSDADSYSVKLKMRASVDEGAVKTRTSRPSSTSSGGTSDTDPVVVTTTSTIEESKTSTISWSFDSLEVVGK